MSLERLKFRANLVKMCREEGRDFQVRLSWEQGRHLEWQTDRQTDSQTAWSDLTSERLGFEKFSKLYIILLARIKRKIGI